MSTTTGKIMKEERLRQRYSRRQMAEAVGCSASMIAAIEDGGKDPSLKLATKISLLLGKSINRLFVCPKTKQIVCDK